MTRGRPILVVLVTLSLVAGGTGHAACSVVGAPPAPSHDIESEASATVGASYSSDGQVAAHRISMVTAISRAQRAMDSNNSSVALNRTFGGSVNDGARSLIETSDGGLAFAGYAGNGGDAWVVKLNSSGDVVLNRTLGGSELDVAYSLVETSDGGLAFAGRTESFGNGSLDAWVVKLNSSGDVVLNRTLGATGDDGAYSLVETSDGGLAFGGYTGSFGNGSADAWVVKLNSSGDIVLNRTIGGSEYDVADSLVETSDGGLAFAGSTVSFGNVYDDGWVVRLNRSGAVVLNRTFGGSEYDVADSLIETSDGGLAFAGATDSFGNGARDGWVVRLNSSGDVVLNRTLGGSNLDAGSSLVETSDGGLTFAGYTGSFGSLDAWVVKLNSSGAVVSTRTLGGSDNDEAVSLVETSDGGLAFAGNAESFGNGADDAWVVKLETQGDSCESIPQAIDSDDDGKIGDFEVLDAIDYWRDGTDVPDTCGETIDDFEILDLIETWRTDSDV